MPLEYLKISFYINKQYFILFIAKSSHDLVSSDCISRDLIQELCPRVLSKINETRNQKVLWNAEQIWVVGHVEKKIMFQGKIN